MGYYSELHLEGVRAQPAHNLPGIEGAENERPFPYRVAYWQRVGEAPRYRYFPSDGGAHRGKKDLRRLGYCVSQQTWIAREGRWI